MCRLDVLPLLAALVVACSCSSIVLSPAPGRGHIVNASGPAPDPGTSNVSRQGVAVVNRSDARSALNVDEATRSTQGVGSGPLDSWMAVRVQAVIWVNSVMPTVFSPTYLCTGAVIGRELVITSATCISRYSKGRLSVSEAQENLAESYRFANVASMSVNYDLDVALLRVDVVEFFTQSSVSKMVDDSDTLVTGDKCTVSGWPYVSHEGRIQWQIQNVSYMSPEDCIAAYSSVTTPISNKLICATPEVGSYSCQENIGWPLFCNGELAGLYSWTYFSCERPGVYSSMKVSAPWITEATASGVNNVPVNAAVVTTSALLLYHLIRALSF